MQQQRLWSKPLTPLTNIERAKYCLNKLAPICNNKSTRRRCNLLFQAKDAMNELEGIDLTDPDLHKAATKIQASFRGHKVRQEVLGNPAQTEQTKK